MRLTVLATLATVASARPFLPDLTSADWAQIQSGFSVENLGSLASGIASGIVDKINGAQKAVEEYSGDDTQKTIWQQINDDSDNYSKLIKVLNFEEDHKKVIDKRQDGYRITFFAPNNDALKCPHHKDDDLEAAFINEQDIGLAQVSAAIDSLETMGGDDKDKKRKKEIFKKIAHYVLQYHVLAQDFDEQALAQNSTIATTLRGPAGGSAGHKLRLHIEKHLVPPSLKLNFHSTIKSTHNAQNGVWHEIDHPLYPPVSIFAEALMITEYLSTTAAGIQAAHGRHFIEWEYDHEKSRKNRPVFAGTPAATFVAPSNKAWDAVPEGLRRFLFSPMGRRALAKTFAYHYLPRQILFSETYHKAKDIWSEDEDEGVWEVDSFGDDPSFKRTIDAPTGLKGHKIKFEIEKKKLLPVEGAVKVSIKVEGKDLQVIDVPASNGAWHIIDEVLCPPHDDKHKHLAPRTWDNWEE
ncbi:hypothetical protein A1Q2_00426 [Trichosporon asahii var. asahii CBS 8904]|uniref:FAS1 domain-containing protein n=1 Tax=Trichosporon asahii var. asahii (strain CBS 8904) TaxID=1220162 RepID=K1VXF6_TRIAC|nr:hypothetical protein A1Q2_00426 [Trichosporon asahii var. asahii CBS 8904]